MRSRGLLPLAVLTPLGRWRCKRVSSVIVAALALAQGAALFILLKRLARGRNRPLPTAPMPRDAGGASVTVVIPARNEALRIGPCLEGISSQGASMAEVIVVDGGSTDGTAALVDRAALDDRRIRRIAEPKKPAGAVGRPWAIAVGCAAAHGDWVLVVDADTVPKPGMVGGAVAAALEGEYDAVSFAPRIHAPGAGARWLQPAFLATLVYRFGPVGIDPVSGERSMANGQCLLMRRATLDAAGGYDVASGSYCDDIRIVRHLAQRGAHVGFLDGRRLLDVTMYRTAAETWRAWPRSLNMRDATSTWWRFLDGLFLTFTMVVPIPLLLATIAQAVAGAEPLSSGVIALGGVNAVLVAVRLLLLIAVQPSFAERGPWFWLSPFADPAAALRVIATTVQRGREWRGRLPAAPMAVSGL